MPASPRVVGAVPRHAQRRTTRNGARTRAPRTATRVFKPGSELGPDSDAEVDIAFVTPNEEFEGLSDEEDVTVPGNNDPGAKVVKEAVEELAELHSEERQVLSQAYDILATIGVRRPDGLEDDGLEGVLDDDDDDDEGENEF